MASRVLITVYSESVINLRGRAFFLESARERDGAYAEAFDAESPDAVSISAAADHTGRSLEAIWENVSMWQTTRRRITLLERALATTRDAPADRRPGE